METTTSRTARRNNALTYAGVRFASYARTTGTLVLVVDGDAHGVDTDGGAQPWSTLCDDHGGVCSHETLQAARQWASAPEQWCPYCMGHNNPTNTQTKESNQ
jgi:hypothetical protein